MNIDHSLSYDFDVIVVGGGHAGIEAAYASARLGSRTLMITLNLDRIGFMPCNPAIGGVGKGHIVFEISALGGLMPKLCTQTYLQARMLNTSKGPAVQGLRLQIDKHAYNKLSKQTLEHTENLTLMMGMVENLILNEKNEVCGIKTREGAQFSARSVILTTGTFLNGLIHIGQTKYSAGRQGDESVPHLSHFLANLGIKIGRLKTGTPPRLLRSSLDFSKMTMQEPDNLDYLFEFKPQHVTSSHACYITHTNEKTHEIIRKNLHLSPMYSGNIKGIGPRYCPSIEDKIARFGTKTSHHVFVEPESASSEEVYPNGISTSLPLEVQKQYVRTIPGFENAIIVRPGYAVEYDFVLPDQLSHSLEVRHVPGLFLAGQINGTTGYEEAAGQGIIAGINAHLKAIGEKPFILSRQEGYIGVMIDDLVTLGVDEPYRMFTSRAERRLSLRQDNVFYRLAQTSYNLGLINKSFYDEIKQEQTLVAQVVRDIRSGKNNDDLLKLLGRDETNIERIHEITNNALNNRAALAVWAEVRYEPYLKRDLKEMEKAQHMQDLEIPESLDVTLIAGLSKELQEKLRKHKPKNIAAASLIPGMTPAAIAVLIFKIREHGKIKAKKDSCLEEVQ
ncbi:tRNA uridine-5-carboxymethylaminomethyl(34) synthesis enzyme MnmG [Candidatus Dependentiae bacterium]|nr:tRNA uridine-5-carboxymethylaminomethyl(34) synthesis enzyme MnmG [Candidatus Dependentiae bacterium]